MINILLSGANGRMGRAVREICRDSDTVRIAAGIDTADTQGADFFVYSDPDDFGGEVDVLVDFSSPAALDKLLPYCKKRGIKMVLCVTGYDAEQLDRIKNCGLPVFMSANMSVGANLLARLAARAAAVLGDFDREIIERHHGQKKDAPSGTAINLYNAVKSADSVPVYDRTGRRAVREKREIGIHAVRGGTIVGDHEVLFAGKYETVSLSHRAENREVFAAGAVRAAAFLAGQTAARVYSMEDLLGDS